MKIILTTDVKKVGLKGQLVTVADGYAMNVLIPKRQAIVATPENMKRHEQDVASAKGRADQSASTAKELLAELDGKTLNIETKMSETGTLFKALHTADIADAIRKEWGIEVPESAIKLDHPIKQKGTYAVPVSLLGSLARVSIIV